MGFGLAAFSKSTIAVWLGENRPRDWVYRVYRLVSHVWIGIGKNGEYVYERKLSGIFLAAYTLIISQPLVPVRLTASTPRTKPKFALTTYSRVFLPLDSLCPPSREKIFAAIARDCLRRLSRRVNYIMRDVAQCHSVAANALGKIPGSALELGAIAQCQK